MPDLQTDERVNQDLGLGGRLSERSRSRIVNHDGSYNVRRNNLGPLHRYNAYNTLLSLPVGQLLALVGVIYLGTNLLFAALYWLGGPDALSGAASGALARFEDCFFFSVQTLSTIGYGRLVPNTHLANALVAIEALIGLLGFAILSGLLFARFTRPTAKMAFSDKALIAPYRSGWALMFRLANLRNHDMTEVNAIVSFAQWEMRDGQRRRRFDQLTLERASIVFMPLHWVIVHPIDITSPLKGHTRESFEEASPEIVCLTSGHDETFGQTVHAKMSYDSSDIAWGARFRDMYVDGEQVTIDLGRLHDYDPVNGPASL